MNALSEGFMFNRTAAMTTLGGLERAGRRQHQDGPSFLELNRESETATVIYWIPAELAASPPPKSLPRIWMEHCGLSY